MPKPSRKHLSAIVERWAQPCLSTLGTIYAKVLDKVRDGYDVYIYRRDEHPPAHCHVWLGDQEAVVELAPIRIRGSSGLHSRDLKKILELIEAHQEELLAVWDSIFPRR